MACVRSMVVWLVCTAAATAQTQHYHHHFGHSHGGTWQGTSQNNSSGGGWSSNSQSNYSGNSGGQASYPQVAISGYRGHRHHRHDHGGYQSPVYQSPVYQTPVYVNTGPIFWAPVAPIAPVTMIPVAAPVSIFPVVKPTLPDPAEDPAKRPIKPSTPAARLRSMEHQASGDEQLRKQLWAQAYMRYRSAIDAAGDRGEARFRQAFTYAVMQHYGPAIREFKRGLFLDRDLPSNGIRLAMLFGPGSEVLRTSLLNKVAAWVKEDPKDSDRLFLLGLLLHYEDDPRSRDVLKAAQRLSSEPVDHVVALLAAQDQQPPPAGNQGLMVELPPLPDAPGAVIQDVPVPQPQGNGLPPLNPIAQPIPSGLPVLSAQPMPPF